MSIPCQLISAVLQQTFELADVPQPLSATTNGAKDFKLPSFDAPPPGWVGPQNVDDPNSKPDMTKWQKSIKVQIDMDNYRPISTSGNTPPKDPPPSKPKCGDHGYTAPYADVDNVNKQLDGRGEEDCCTDDQGGCNNIGTGGNIAVDLCADAGVKLCVACARLANYVAGLEDTCQQKVGDTVMVGGTQDIVETPGLQVQV